MLLKIYKLLLSPEEVKELKKPFRQLLEREVQADGKSSDFLVPLTETTPLSVYPVSEVILSSLILTGPFSTIPLELMIQLFLKKSKLP